MKKPSFHIIILILHTFCSVKLHANKKSCVAFHPNFFQQKESAHRQRHGKDVKKEKQKKTNIYEKTSRTLLTWKDMRQVRLEQLACRVAVSDCGLLRDVQLETFFSYSVQFRVSRRTVRSFIPLFLFNGMTDVHFESWWEHVG